jgi:hypothetical protein
MRRACRTALPVLASAGAALFAVARADAGSADDAAASRRGEPRWKRDSSSTSRMLLMII